MRVTRKTRALLGLCVSVGLFALPMGASSVTAAAHPKLPTFTPAQIDGQAALRHPSVSANAAVAVAGPKLKTYTAKAVDTGVTYTYKIVGKNPAIATTTPSTSVKTQIVPLNIVFAGVANWDPTVADDCDTGVSALVRTQNSPIVKTHSYTWGGAAIGSAQYIDAFQRAQSYLYTKPTGINPGYHVKLTVSTLPTITVNVPLTSAAALTTACGNKLLGAIEINWLDAYVQGTLIPSLAASGVAPNTFPIFLVHNVVEYFGSQCCILGFHNAYTPPAGGNMQTYAVVDYDNSSAFSGPIDVSVLAHEVGEWMDDPYTNNPTRPWGHIGQVGGCQNNLENGDPLSGTTILVHMNGFDYHPQELAFISWFYRQASISPMGWYSNNGTFTTTQGTCT